MCAHLLAVFCSINLNGISFNKLFFLFFSFFFFLSFLFLFFYLQADHDTLKSNSTPSSLIPPKKNLLHWPLWVDSFNSVAPLTTVSYHCWVCLSVALVPVLNNEVTLHCSAMLHHIWVADRWKIQQLNFSKKQNSQHFYSYSSN